MFVCVCMRVHYTELRDASCLVFHVLDALIQLQVDECEGINYGMRERELLMSHLIMWNALQIFLKTVFSQMKT